MNNWYHVTKGQYNITDETIHLDFGNHIGDTKQLEATLIHESIHAALADLEFGQATRNAYTIIPKARDLSATDQSEMMKLLFEAQDFVQEGFATLMQFLWLAQEITKEEALDLAEKILPPLYLERLKKFSFVFGLSPRYRDFFTSKVSVLAMETGIREIAAREDIFRTPETLKKYLSDEDANPNARLEKMIETIKKCPWMVTKPNDYIAHQSSLTFHAPTSKANVAGFLTYMASRMGDTRIYTESEIGDAPDPDSFFKSIPEEVVLGNLNQRFSEQGEIIFKLEDFLHYADVAKIIFITPYRGTPQDRAELEPLTEETPEILLGMIASTGAKYVTVTSRATAERILSADLKFASLLTKEGAFAPATGEFLGSATLRRPDFIIYNTAKSLLAEIQKFLEKNPDTHFNHFYAAVMDGHYLRTLYVKIEGQTPIHVVNVLGGGGVDQIIDLIKDRSRTMTADKIRGEKAHYNHLFEFWMGMPKEVDWVETMLDFKKSKLYMQDGTILIAPS